MIRLFWKDGSSCDPDAIGFAATSKLGEPVRLPWDTLSKLVLLDGTYEIVETTWNGMPLRVIRWTDTSDLVVELPMPHPAAEEMGKALAGQKIHVATHMPSRLWTPPGGGTP